MRLPALKHLIEATQALCHPERIRVLGSSALLASFPELGEPGQPLEISFDAELLIAPADIRQRLDAMTLTEAEIVSVFRRLRDVSR